MTLINPLCAVLAYTSDAPTKPEPDRLKEQLMDPLDHETIRIIAVLDKGLWVFAEEGRYREEPEPSRVGEMFVLNLLNRLEEAADSRGPFRLQEWIK